MAIGSYCRDARQAWVGDNDELVRSRHLDRAVRHSCVGLGTDLLDPGRHLADVGADLDAGITQEVLIVGSTTDIAVGPSNTASSLHTRAAHRHASTHLPRWR